MQPRLYIYHIVQSVVVGNASVLYKKDRNKNYAFFAEEYPIVSTFCR